MAVYRYLHPVPLQFQDPVSSANLSGGTLYFYESGTVTATDLFSDSSGTSIGSSITLDSGGFPSVGGNVITLFRDQSVDLKIVGKNAAGATIFTSDEILAEASFDSTSSAKLDGIEALADVTDATNVGAVVNGLQEEPIDLAQFILPTTGACGPIATVEGTAGMPVYRGYPFDGATAENIEFTWQPPKQWNLGTVTVMISYSTAATDADGVVWGVKAVALSDGDSFAQAYGTPVTVTDTLQSGAGQRLSCTTGAITIGGTPADADWVAFRIYRDATHASNTATEDMTLLGAKIFWTSDALNDA